jgi:Uma2 family endonuclease
MGKTQTRIGPADHGRRMSLADFDLADREYWIIDADRGEAGEMLVLRRVGGRWVEKLIRPPGIHYPRLLPDLAFDIAAVFQAARGQGN